MIAPDAELSSVSQPHQHKTNQQTGNPQGWTGKRCPAFSLTNRMPRKTDRPLTISSPRSTRDASTITKSKTFQPLRKKSTPSAPNFKMHSVVKTEVKTYSSSDSDDRHTQKKDSANRPISFSSCTTLPHNIENRKKTFDDSHRQRLPFPTCLSTLHCI